MQHRGSPMNVRLVVATSLESGWRAAVTGPDEAARVFFGPFELGRCLAGPVARGARALHGGLRQRPGA